MDSKRPESVLVVVHAPHRALLLRRVQPPDFWQSVTGSLRWDERLPIDAARRELLEETGLGESAGCLRDAHTTHRFPILPSWRDRYAPADDENTEHVFYFAVSAEQDIRVNPAEHSAWAWVPFDIAAAKVASWTNRDAIRALVVQ